MSKAAAKSKPSRNRDLPTEAPQQQASPATASRRKRVVWSRASQAQLIRLMARAEEPYTPQALAARLTKDGFYATSTQKTFSAAQVAAKARKLARMSDGALRMPLKARVKKSDLKAIIADELRAEG